MRRYMKPNKKDFVEVGAAGIFMFLLHHAVNAAFGFIFWQFVKELWERYCEQWWNKWWGKDDVAENATKKIDPRE